MNAPGASRILLFGMRCGFTLPVAQALLADPDVEVTGVIVPAQGCADTSPSPNAGRGGHPLDTLLRENHIPLTPAPSLRKHALQPLLERLAPEPLDAIVVACFPWRLPRWLRALPRFGALNVHPSLLPALRGPEPEFWAIRLGVRETGVTIHLMDEGLDTGPILVQRPVPIPPDVALPGLETSLARVGGELAREALKVVASGTAQLRTQAGIPTYAPAPGAYDLTIPTDLPAGWAARFARAVAPVYAPLPVLIMATGQRLLIDRVIDVDEYGTLARPIEADGETAAVRFSPGVVSFHRTVAATARPV